MFCHRGPDKKSLEIHRRGENGITGRAWTSTSERTTSRGTTSCRGLWPRGAATAVLRRSWAVCVFVRVCFFFYSALCVKAMAKRLQKKVDAVLLAHATDPAKAERALCEALDAQEILTAAQLPLNSRVRNAVANAFRRDAKERAAMKELRAHAREEELVPVEVHGGGKCKMTIYMTKEAAERQR